jgi:hypothetical protein
MDLGRGIDHQMVQPIDGQSACTVELRLDTALEDVSGAIPLPLILKDTCLGLASIVAIG